MTTAPNSDRIETKISSIESCLLTMATMINNLTQKIETINIAIETLKSKQDNIEDETWISSGMRC